MNNPQVKNIKLGVFFALLDSLATALASVFAKLIINQTRSQILLAVNDHLPHLAPRK